MINNKIIFKRAGGWRKSQSKIEIFETPKFFNKNFWRFSKFRMNFGTGETCFLGRKTKPMKIENFRGVKIFDFDSFAGPKNIENIFGGKKMKAVVYKGPKNVEVEEVENPKIRKPTDAIVRITSSAICGSDLHMYDGETTFESGRTLGHEPMGVVEEVGDAVQLVKPGDRVVMPFNIACGFCLNCIQGMTNACLTLNPDQPGSAYGYVNMGPYQGGQAEYVLVPFADWACLKLPGEPGDEFEDDFVLLADIFPTSYYSTELANVSIGKAVAVFGAGPVGLLAAYSAILKGASEVYIIDDSQERLKRAESIGAVPINTDDGDPAQQIMEMRQNNKNLMESLRPGEEKTLGVDSAIDAVGFQAYDRENPNQEKRNQVLMDIANVINAG